MESRVTKNGRVRVVKNLGWLLRHWKDVESFWVKTNISGGAYLTAILRGGGEYTTRFADKGILRKFLDRRIFRGVVAEWNGERVHIGSAAWRLSPSGKEW
jgi:hypothetical protein